MEQEVRITLPEGRVVLVLGRNVAQVPAVLIAGYYPGEDTGPASAPYKLTVELGMNTLQEFALTFKEANRIARLWALMRRRGGHLPHSVSDQ